MFWVSSQAQFLAKQGDAVCEPLVYQCLQPADSDKAAFNSAGQEREEQQKAGVTDAQTGKGRGEDTLHEGYEQSTLEQISF